MGHLKRFFSKLGKKVHKKGNSQTESSSPDFKSAEYSPATTPTPTTSPAQVSAKPQSTKVTPNSNLRENLEAIIRGIQENKILEVFDKYYHPEIVMYEKGDSTNRVGFEANRKAEQGFVSNATIHEAKVLKIIVDGENTGYEMYMDFTYGGNKVQKTQWAFQQWKDNKVIKEEFF
ncbi:hypothetical protein PPL_09333 [Heterostelium album PN500]|uniref:Nuclear transport factor 2 family protein n=1 Tax=Heterostelium pallidum (strain ATCC 26659 / Pp 5 / PN500) TaxID=670386 RepID=D3BLA1_HETP5|nr:hypothetical protein PPL_09333 [Heterostelium album PN500]EFA77835.1 hypothetical protein PPL_09333 [Heterostelium album PN500]|eukprot:XP_020429963.1 hypothetical protein PPL_09333 [Heterostelium album PN500]